MRLHAPKSAGCLTRARARRLPEGCRHVPRQQRFSCSRARSTSCAIASAPIDDGRSRRPPAKWAEPERCLQRLARAEGEGRRAGGADPLYHRPRLRRQMRAAGALDFRPDPRAASCSRARRRPSCARDTHVLGGRGAAVGPCSSNMKPVPSRAGRRREPRRRRRRRRRRPGERRSWSLPHPQSDGSARAPSVAAIRYYRSSAALSARRRRCVAHMAARMAKAALEVRRRVQIVDAGGRRARRDVASELRARASGGTNSAGLILFRTARSARRCRRPRRQPPANLQAR